MASLTPENRAFMEDFENLELSQVDGALLMSFLDDTQVLEDCDDERLTSVMRSLEAEIDLHVTDDKNSFMQDSTWNSNSSGESSSSNKLDFDWMEMETMETEMVPPAVASLPGADLMANWYMDATNEHQVDGAIDHYGFGNMDLQRDYFQISNYGISFDDHEHGSYSTLWQETNHASMVHG